MLPGSAQTQGGLVSTASFSVVVPTAAAGVKTPASLVVSLVQVNGATPGSKSAAFTMNLTPTTHGCSPMAGGALSCTAIVPAPAGNDSFALTTFTGINGTGAQITTSQAKAMVSANGKTKCVPATASVAKKPV
ncbi:MAG: hypothetical protein M3N13_05920 [Candidatus Eremiobacteraeota bacterium]|nr:hypothetical protein [Candidatus Eremiobacteraeota bacterium]